MFISSLKKITYEKHSENDKTLVSLALIILVVN